ncbi:unnamed protein product [Cuscuta epithymum]|uniref:Uncharacterized protein n=1 Tax=Cuscuta epithymum TaxID=186058 RepID=A0AAV0EJ19_9ASTE|nr:unnamed protein product [Cuscuta epithymum]CAH9123733.1 unnamed protein product [Cuscuta epithymum]
MVDPFSQTMSLSKNKVVGCERRNFEGQSVMKTVRKMQNLVQEENVILTSTQTTHSGLK